jgi:SpoVK/Ycf46/Vps4 family AAA+-type ATPase
VIDRILQERRSSDLLIKAGIEPATSVLLVGPPGTGKTMTARYIASTVGLPLITMDLAAVMSSYLGGTGQNIREALDLARQSPAVLFLDEFDALGKRRDDPSDVGELKRIVNVLLMEIENWPANGLLIAATNHPELLDRAVWRRFDLVVELQMPSAIERKEILSQLMLEHSRDVSTTQMDELVSLTYRMSGSDIARVTREALRRNALGADDPIEILIRGVVLQQLLRESASNPKSRALYAELSSRVLGHSYRQIADVLGVSHVTVGKLIRTSEKERISPL